MKFSLHRAFRFEKIATHIQFGGLNMAYPFGSDLKHSNQKDEIFKQQRR